MISIRCFAFCFDISFENNLLSNGEMSKYQIMMIITARRIMETISTSLASVNSGIIKEQINIIKKKSASRFPFDFRNQGFLFSSKDGDTLTLLSK